MANEATTCREYVVPRLKEAGRDDYTAEAVRSLFPTPDELRDAWVIPDDRQAVIEKLNEELEQIPFAYGPWTEGQDPATATITTSNFEVVAPATRTTTSVYLPLALRGFTASTPSNSAGPMSLDEVTYWAYQIQDISASGAVDALVASHYDMLVLEPTRTDWSSDDKYFDTRGMVTQLKDSQASDGTHRKLVIAYVDIGEAEDWRWYWSWSENWDCVGDPPADWPRRAYPCRLA